MICDCSMNSQCVACDSCVHAPCRCNEPGLWDLAYRHFLREAREGCCHDWPKPCTYHEGWGAGFEMAERLGGEGDR